MDELTIIEVTSNWVSEVVIGLNLCPFARRPFAADLIRYAVTPVATEAELLDALGAELTRLVATPRAVVETTLLIHPNALADFLDYNDFLAVADTLVRDLDLEGVIQIASFHPEYQFGGTKTSAVENYTNRSPYPMLHLLREESVSEVNGDPAAIAGIPERNIATLKKLGRAGILELLNRVKHG